MFKELDYKLPTTECPYYSRSVIKVQPDQKESQFTTNPFIRFELRNIYGEVAWDESYLYLYVDTSNTLPIGINGVRLFSGLRVYDSQGIKLCEIQELGAINDILYSLQYSQDDIESSMLKFEAQLHVSGADHPMIINMKRLGSFFATGKLCPKTLCQGLVIEFELANPLDVCYFNPKDNIVTLQGADPSVYGTTDELKENLLINSIPYLTLESTIKQLRVRPELYVSIRKLTSSISPDILTYKQHKLYTSTCATSTAYEFTGTITIKDEVSNATKLYVALYPTGDKGLKWPLMVGDGLDLFTQSGVPLLETQDMNASAVGAFPESVGKRYKVTVGEFILQDYTVPIEVTKLNSIRGFNSNPIIFQHNSSHTRTSNRLTLDTTNGFGFFENRHSIYSYTPVVFDLLKCQHLQFSGVAINNSNHINVSVSGKMSSYEYGLGIRPALYVWVEYNTILDMRGYTSKVFK